MGCEIKVMVVLSADNSHIGISGFAMYGSHKHGRYGDITRRWVCGDEGLRAYMLKAGIRTRGCCVNVV